MASKLLPLNSGRRRKISSRAAILAEIVRSRGVRAIRQLCHIWGWGEAALAVGREAEEDLGREAMAVKKPPGAEFEVSIDGTTAHVSGRPGDGH